MLTDPANHIKIGEMQKGRKWRYKQTKNIPFFIIYEDKASSNYVFVKINPTLIAFLIGLNSNIIVDFILTWKNMTKASGFIYEIGSPTHYTSCVN